MSESISWRAGLKVIMRPQYEWISEVIASIPQISCYVGFKMGTQRKVILIWVWPLNAEHPSEKFFWLDDKTWGPLTYMG